MHRKERPRAALLCSMLAWCAMLGLHAPRALAARGHSFQGTFSGPCLAEPCEGALREPDGVAVDEATGDLYVVDKGADRVVRFGSGGGYLSELNGSGALPGEGAAAGSLGREGEVSSGRFEAPQTIAVDNSCSLRRLGERECEEADPSSGDVYVVDAGHRVIDKFSAAGEYLGQITGAPSRFARPIDGVAVDPGGGVWVYLDDRTIAGFGDDLANRFLSRTSPVKIEGAAAPGLAVDAEGDFYLGDVFEGGRIAKVDASGAVLIGELDGEVSTRVAVDQATGEAVLDNLTTLGVFDSSGALLERLGEEEGAKHLTAGAGVAVDAGSGTFYVADAATDRVVVFGPAPPSTPVVEGESFAHVTSDGAALAGRLDPRSFSDEPPSEYSFEYGLCPTLSTCSSSDYEARVPAPFGRIDPDFEVHEVAAEIAGLRAHATYHFRLLARNSHGEGRPGAEVSFTTRPAEEAFVLPDGRGWELVSPPDKQGARIEALPEAGVVQAAADGSAITFLANAPTEARPEGYAGSVQVLSRRGPAEWSSRDIAIPHSAAAGLGTGPEYKFFDRELQLSAVQPFGQFDSGLSEEASESTAFLRELTSTCAPHCYRPLVTGKPGYANVPPGTTFGEEAECLPRPGGAGAAVVCGPEFVDATEDLSHVVLRARVGLLPGAEPGLYEWFGGSLAPVSVLPNGEPAPASALGLSQGGESQATRRAISADGSRIVWSYEGDLYLRDMARGETVQLDRPQAGCGACGGGGGSFQIASADGSRVLFTDERPLSEASGKAGGRDLYECRIGLDAEGRLGCGLTDLTPKRGSESAQVQGSVLGASADGSYVYLVARGVLSEAPNALGQSALAGRPNLYLLRDGVPQFLATLSAGDEHDWAEELVEQPTRVSSDGRFLALMSQASPTGYDNRDLSSGAPVAEVYLYDASTARLRCVSCEPTAERPVGVEFHKLEPGSGGLVGGPLRAWVPSALVAANVPGWTAIGKGHALEERHQPRYLLDDGRLFFDTAAALVPQDKNGTQDVYEYEPLDVGGCRAGEATFGERSGGCVALISSGGSSRESAFLDASESGEDVFFLTEATLSALDLDDLLDVYDAHVCTGSTPCIGPAQAPAPPCASEGSCKAPPTPQPSAGGLAPTSTLASEGPPIAPIPQPRPSAPSRAQKLAKALKACRARKRGRKACERRARKRYGIAKHRPKAAAGMRRGTRRPAGSHP